MSRIAVALALLALACQRGEEDLSGFCDEARTPLEMAEASPLGFTGQQVADLALTGAPWADTLTWARGGTTPLVIGFSPPTAARFVEATPEYPDGAEIDLALECPDRVEVDLPATFATDDGAFHEAWEVTLARFEDVEPPTAALFLEVDPTALTGTYDVTLDVDETDYETLTLFVTGAFDGATTAGDLVAQVTGEEVCEGNECTAWAAEHDVATWGPPAP